MIHFLKGDLFQSNADAFVNTVNTEGVMGKGIALQVKRRYPGVFKTYEAAVARGEIQIGKVQVVPTNEFSPRYIINFPTKTSWRKPSQLRFIQEGLPALVEALLTYDIKSVAIPPLGAGNGGLDWSDVKPLILAALDPIATKVDVSVYEPTVMQFQASVTGGSWTRAQLLISSALFAYRSLGDSLTQIEIQKLAYFLDRAGAGLNLHYKAHRYGPYSDRLRHLVSGLEGRIIYGLNAGKAKAHDELLLNHNLHQEVEDTLAHQLQAEQAPWITVRDLIQGWESPYGLELLATLDWCLQLTPELDDRNLVGVVAQWGGTENPEWGRRKASTMKEEHLRLAFAHLKRFQPLLEQKLAV